jgi:hypothetical protein
MFYAEIITTGPTTKDIKSWNAYAYRYVLIVFFVRMAVNLGVDPLTPFHD